MVLLISKSHDNHIKRIEKEVKKLNSEVMLLLPFNCDNWPSIQNNYIEGCDSVTSILKRDTSYIRFNTKDKKEVFQKSLAQMESNFFLSNLVATYSEINKDIFVINEPFNTKFGNYKNIQLLNASKVGLEIPETICTANVKEIKSFSAKFENVIIKNYKASFNFGDEYLSSHTRVIDKSMLSNIDTESLDHPSIFQEQINKLFELRIIVVGNKIFAFEIYSQQHDEAKIDFRKANHLELNYKVHELPLVIEQNIFKFMKSMNLNYGAIDMIYTPEKKYIFLEVNSTGQYLWLEKATGVNVSKQMAKLLVDPSSNRLC